MDPLSRKKHSMITLFLGVIFILVYIFLLDKGVTAKFFAAVFFIIGLYLLFSSLFHFYHYKKNMSQ